jgi:hypothetical protein
MCILSVSSYGGKRRHRPDNLDISPDQTCFKFALDSCCVASSVVPPSQHKQAGSALVPSSSLLEQPSASQFVFNKFSSVSPTSAAFVWGNCHGTSHWKLLERMWKDAVMTQFHCLEGTEE